MEKNEFSIIVKIIRTAYNSPDFLPTTDHLATWFEMLRDVPYSEAFNAVMNHIKTSQYQPSIADIRKAYDERVKAESTAPELTPSEAWQIVARTISQYGRNRGNEAFDDLLDYDDGERILKAVKSCGWQYLCNEDEAKAKRAFVAEYREQGGTVGIRMLEGSA